MPIVDSLEEAERQVANELQPKLAAYSAVTERAFNTAGLVLGAAPEVPISQVALSRKTATVLMVRLSNDLRAVALTALHGYALQAASLTSSMYEVAYCIAYIGSDDTRAESWVKHEDPTKPFRSAWSLTKDVVKGLPNPAKAAKTQYQVYQQLCLVKHSNPIIQQDHGHYVDEEAVIAVNGPDSSDRSVRVARFALEHATRLTVLGLASFLNNHVPVERRKVLVERLNSIGQEVKDLTQAAIKEYGNENPYPGKWGS